MDRRLVGMAVLGLVLLAAAAAPQLTRPDVIGAAQQVSMVEPEVGDCVVEAGPILQIVPCRSRHTGEVAAVWPAATARNWSRRGELSTRCRDAADAYVGIADPYPPVAGPWRSADVMFSVSTAPRWRPAVPRGSRPHWRTCLVLPILGSRTVGYLGSVRALTTTSVLPKALRYCYTGSMQSACDQPHTGERLGSRTVVFTGSAWPVIDAPYDPTRVPTTAEFEADCRSYAARRMGVEDPTFGGRLKVVVISEFLGLSEPAAEASLYGGGKFGGDTDRTEATSGSSGRLPMTSLSCAVEPVAETRLLDSVVGLGAQPLPIE